MLTFVKPTATGKMFRDTVTGQHYMAGVAIDTKCGEVYECTEKGKLGKMLCDNLTGRASAERQAKSPHCLDVTPLEHACIALHAHHDTAHGYPV